MEQKVCQSCAMPLTDEKEIGTNKDGSKSEDYCIYCYKDGEFTHNLTMEETIEHSANYADMAGMSREQAIEYARKVYPTLKRWS